MYKHSLFGDSSEESEELSPSAIQAHRKNNPTREPLRSRRNAFLWSHPAKNIEKTKNDANALSATTIKNDYT